MAPTSTPVVVRSESNELNNCSRGEKQTETNEANSRYGFRHLDHEISIKKCLRQQLDATYRQDYSFKQTGGGFRLFLSTGFYQEFKRISHLFYKSMKKQGMLDMSVSEMKDRNKVCEYSTFRIWSNKPKCSFRYTLNMYHTKCSALINGSHEEIFVNEHLPDLLCMINDKRASSINRAIKDTLSTSHVLDTSQKTTPVQLSLGANKCTSTTTKTHVNRDPESQVMSNTNFDEEVTLTPTCTHSITLEETSRKSVTINNNDETTPVIASSRNVDELSPKSVANYDETTPKIICQNRPDTTKGRRLALSMSNSKTISSKIRPRWQSSNKITKTVSSTSNSNGLEVTNLQLTIKNLEATIMKQNETICKQNETMQLDKVALTAMAYEKCQALEEMSAISEENNTFVVAINKLTIQIDSLNELNQNLQDDNEKLTAENAKLQKFKDSTAEKNYLDNNRVPVNNSGLQKISQLPQPSSCSSNLNLNCGNQNMQQNQNAHSNSRPCSENVTLHPKFETVRPIEIKKNIVLGSSILKYIKPSRLDFNWNTSVRTLRGAKIHDLDNYIRKYPLPPNNIVENVVMLVGSNNVSSRCNYDQCREQYENLITTVKQKFPSASIKFLQLLPRVSDTFNVNLVNMNKVLKEVCLEHSCTYIRTNDVFFNKEGKVNLSLFHKDETHIDFVGTARLAIIIKGALNIPLAPKVHVHRSKPSQSPTYHSNLPISNLGSQTPAYHNNFSISKLGSQTANLKSLGPFAPIFPDIRFPPPPSFPMLPYRYQVIPPMMR
ncbi:hypothetical protein SNE40_004358 [Patella caerulea]|uniref:Uncharacterized protein n=1 Tax=Patella caerulea TaxID=87958 RepID=A0AAN8K2V7_PATCE